LIHNPDLDGSPFYWRGGPVGVLLIHGFTATVAEVRPLAEALLSAGYTVAGPLLPGHYTQPADLNQVRWRDWVTAVEAAYQNLSAQSERVVVGGESTGGLLSLYLATLHPEIAALLLYAPALQLTLKPSSILRIFLFSPFVPWVPKDYMDDNPLWQGYPVNPLRGVIQLLKLQKKVRPLLSLVRQPTLIVQGRSDTSVRPEVPDTIYNGIQSSLREKIWMEKSGHCVLLDQERQVIFDMTLRFLERVLQTSPDLTPKSAT
jgi:carboxylesterase